MPKPDPLAPYNAKRDFSKTAEPSGAVRHEPPPGATRTTQPLRFVIQKHAARNLHYDFRLELGGTLKSWAVPKGPSLDPSVKRMGVHVEDHPLGYASFEGTIAPNQYGAGEVIVWDHGSWTPLGDPALGFAQGKLKFELQGEKLRGGWTLVRMKGRARDTAKEPWLLIKEKDTYARPGSEFDVLQALPGSVITGKLLGAVASESSEATGLPRKPAQTARQPPPRRRAKAPSTSLPAPAPVSSEQQTSDALAGALKAALPDTLAPQLATLVAHPPAEREGWLYEIKFDGYRLLTRIDGESVQCFTRNGHDWSARLPTLCKSIARLGLESAWLDGEIVVLNAAGLPDFGALQNAFEQPAMSAKPLGPRAGQAPGIRYFVFDLPFFGGLDLRQVPLATRRAILCAAITESPQPDIVFSDSFDAPVSELLASNQQLGLEGLIGKRADSHYTSGRSSDWIKLKTRLRQEFVIGGYTAPQGSRSGLGALLLGEHDEVGKLRYAGNVGTGFNAQSLQLLEEKLRALRSETDPFADMPRSVRAQWVRPELLAEVAFAEWTQTGRVRQAAFIGLRSDKPARQIVREVALQEAGSPPEAKANQPARRTRVPNATPAASTQRVTHPERVIDAASGATKAQLVDYYAAVSKLLLPHLLARPVALVRAPNGVDGELFFQKHAAATTISGARLLDPALDPGHAALLVIDSPKALLAAAQLNVIELHTWNATEAAIGQPDRMTFDLDPGEGVSWAQVQQGAQLVRTLLDELQLPAFLKTSGGKGLHVVVPLKVQADAPDFDTVKDFSHALVDHLAQVLPQIFVAKSGPKNRVGKIFVDYLRNGWGATTAAAWSARARPGMGVSVPVAWDELSKLTSGAHWGVATMGDRLATGNQPWDDYDSSRCKLEAAMHRLGFQAAEHEKPKGR
jgi:bifunctional non-homologous end joining protein LigD